MSNQSRRSFLKQSMTAGAALAAAGPMAGRLLADDEEAKPGFKYAMCNETFVDWPQRKIFNFLGKCGYTGVEIAPFTINNDVTKVSAKQRKRLRKQAEDAGIEIVGLHWLLSKTEGLHLTSPDKAVRAKTAKYIAALADFCGDLGGTAMIFGSPKQRNIPEGVTREDAIKYAAEVLQEAMPTLAKRKVVLGLEPLGPKETNFMATTAEALQVAKAVNSPNCKLMLDCKAMIHEKESIPELIHKYGKWTIHFHANDPNLQGPGMGELDFVPIFRALKDIDFKGWISVETFDYTPGPEKIARDSLRYMQRVERKVFGGKKMT